MKKIFFMLILIISVCTFTSQTVSARNGPDLVKSLDELNNDTHIAGDTVIAVFKASAEVSSSSITRLHNDNEKIIVIDSIAKSIYTKRYDSIADTLKGICSSKEGTFERQGVGKLVKDTININTDSIFNKYTFNEIRSDTKLIASK